MAAPAAHEVLPLYQAGGIPGREIAQGHPESLLEHLNRGSRVGLADLLVSKLLEQQAISDPQPNILPEPLFVEITAHSFIIPPATGEVRAE